MRPLLHVLSTVQPAVTHLYSVASGLVCLCQELASAQWRPVPVRGQGWLASMVQSSHVGVISHLHFTIVAR